jgi:hypothetical protein
MATGVRARMATMRMRTQLRRKKHRKPMMDQRRMWRTDLGTSDVDRYQYEDGNDADTDKVEEASQADEGSMGKVEDSGHSTGECEVWTVYFRYEK